MIVLADRGQRFQLTICNRCGGKQRGVKSLKLTYAKKFGILFIMQKLEVILGI